MHSYQLDNAMFSSLGQIITELRGYERRLNHAQKLADSFIFMNGWIVQMSRNDR